MAGFSAGKNKLLFDEAALALFFCSLQPTYSTRNSKQVKESQRGLTKVL